MTGPGARGGVVATVVLGLGAVLGACGSADSSTGGSADSPDLDGSWHLVSGHDAEGDLLPPEAREVSLVVEGDEASGTSACNLYGAAVAVKGRSVSFGQIGGTEMACEPPVMELERRYLAALSATERGERSGDALSLSGSDIALEFALDEPVVDADLVGTAWMLESLVDGESVSSTVPGGSLVLRESGTFEASSGCGDLIGSFRLHDSAVAVSSFQHEPAATARCTAQAVSQHEHMVDVLREGFTAQIDGDRLTLTSTQELGLVFRAG